jgi:hypothetical protein
MQIDANMGLDKPFSFLPPVFQVINKHLLVLLKSRRVVNFRHGGASVSEH